MEGNGRNELKSDGHGSKRTVIYENGMTSRGNERKFKRIK